MPVTSTASLESLLNPSQLRAVTTYDGPQLILAGAGSGKTRVLTYKIAGLLEGEKARPQEIMAVTFTNKAAGEMRDRLAKILQHSVSPPWLGTFHSVCARILRQHGSLLGYTSNFTIYDKEDQKRCAKKVLKEASDESLTPEMLRYRISHLKNKNLTPEEARREAAGLEEETNARYYQAYQNHLMNNNAMDFDDLICQTIRLLQQHTDIRERFQTQLKYILIDEFQDTNRAQFHLIKLLLGSHNNLTVVGDDDQSIYGWRGAEIKNILSFHRLFPLVDVVKLEQNYRSTQNILGIARSVITKNAERMDKEIWTANPEGEPVRLRECETDLEEAQWVVAAIDRLGPEHYRDTAIFYRTNSQSRVLEDHLRRAQIPYLLLGSIRFYDRKEIKDILAYLQVLSNPRDSVSLGRIINVPKRGIGDRTVEVFADRALQHNLTLYESLKGWPEAGLSAGLQKKVGSFLKLMQNLEEQKDKATVSQLIEKVIEESGYREALENENTSEAFDRLSNIEELVAAAEDFEARQEDSSLDAFLQEISLFTQVDQRNDKGAVTLMTVHSAKGLEFPRVYITGMEDGLFPLTRNGEEENLEEERRLFYVAVTRAEQFLTITYSNHRRVWGNVQYNLPSRFLKETDPKFLHIEGPDSTFQKPGRPAPSGRHYEPVEQDMPDYENDFQPQFTAEPSVPTGLQSTGLSGSTGGGAKPRKGQHVRHAKFGPGKVLGVEGSGDNCKLLISFQNGMPRRMVLKFAKLQFLN